MAGVVRVVYSADRVREAAGVGVPLQFGGRRVVYTLVRGTGILRIEFDGKSFDGGDLLYAFEELLSGDNHMTRLQKRVEGESYDFR